nr:hypothetical protein [Bradyrhizobium sp. 76]
MAQLARKELLKQLIDENGLEAPIFYSEHHEGDGQALFEAASKLIYEGIVSKRVDAPYRSDRRGKSCASWEKSARAGAGRSRPRSARRSIPSSARSRSSPSLSGNRRPHGSSHSSTPTSNTGTSPPKACCAPARLKG